MAKKNEDGYVEATQEVKEEAKVETKPKRKKPKSFREGVTIMTAEQSTKADRMTTDEEGNVVPGKRDDTESRNVWGTDRVFKPYED